MAAMSITLDKSDVASAAMHVAKQLGYPEMKDLQVKVVVDFVCGRDVFAVLPTGYGKSLCSQRKNLVHDLGQDHGQDQGGMDYCGQIPQHLAPRSWP